MKQNKYIQYEEVIKRQNHIDKLVNEGFIIIPKRRFKILGWVCIGLGVLTIPIPLTTIPLLAIGFLLLGLSKYELIEKIRKKIKKRLYKLRK